MQNIPFSIIDAHIHQWDPYHTPHAAAFAVKLLGKHPKLLDRLVRLIKPKAVIETIGLTEHITAPYLPQDYAHDIGHYVIDKVIHVEASWHEHKGTGVVNETRFIESLPFHETSIQLAAIVATADPRQKNFKEILQMHQEASDKFRGIRKMAAVHPNKAVYAWADEPHLYKNPKFLKGFEHLAHLNLSFDAWVYSNQIEDVIYLAQQFPQTPIVLDHLGTPVGMFGTVGKRTGRSEKERQYIFEKWKFDLARLAELPNVYSKVSGLFMPVLGHRFHQQQRLATKDQILSLAYPLIQHAFDCFGAKRLMFASNFPMDSVSTDLVSIIDAFSDIIHTLNPNALAPIFRENAAEFYRL
ncbi:amidohydrolase [Acinetobacter sp. NCu2D-2]|uniref:amidohydrolase family protein n=1 Tax=Acinetobacter sp. NCu2D-2 TaxID=1608473 RepID=UPI0007CDA1B1|nr:amidohydrolase family protein [Acinetobacter sp. NCu2D-2]ANF81565.1 amidohydrolase [Acinetobacter sp. NCu2D-2]